MFTRALERCESALVPPEEPGTLNTLRGWALADILSRFSSLPVHELRKKLDSQTRDLEVEVEKLSKRLLYLETTHKNSREHIEQILQSR